MVASFLQILGFLFGVLPSWLAILIIAFLGVIVLVAIFKLLAIIWDSIPFL